MLDIIKDSIRITNKYIILATPLILFSLIAHLYILFSANGNALSFLFAVILFFLMLGAFLSGWLYMIKRCILNPETEDVNALITEFPAGVGEYFLSMCGLIFVIFIVLSVMFFGTYVIGMKTIGSVKDIYEPIIYSGVTTEAFRNYILSLPAEKLIKLNKWNLLIMSAFTVSYFLIMFYSPVVMFKKKNPFSAFFICLKDLFSRCFLKNVLLYMLIFCAYIFLSIITTIFSGNIVLHFVFTLLSFYYIIFIAIYVYNYYYKNFVQIGSNIDTRV